MVCFQLFLTILFDRFNESLFQFDHHMCIRVLLFSIRTQILNGLVGFIIEKMVYFMPFILLHNILRYDCVCVGGGGGWQIDGPKRKYLHHSVYNVYWNSSKKLHNLSLKAQKFAKMSVFIQSSLHGCHSVYDHSTRVGNDPPPHNHG